MSATSKKNRRHKQREKKVSQLAFRKLTDTASCVGCEYLMVYQHDAWARTQKLYCARNLNPGLPAPYTWQEDDSIDLAPILKNECLQKVKDSVRIGLHLFSRIELRQPHNEKRVEKLLHIRKPQRIIIMRKLEELDRE